MYLPAGGTIYKEDGCIHIRHPSFSIKTEILYTASNAYIPREFKRWYLGINENHYIDYSYSVKIDVTFRWWTAFGQKYKKYYRWIDGFISRLDDLMSEDTFYKKIEWETASTVMLCLEKQHKGYEKKE